MQRVYAKLENDHGETYALLWIFSMRTAIELHRGWHMTLLTSKLLQQIKEKFNKPLLDSDPHERPWFYDGFGCMRSKKDGSVWHD